MELTPFEQSHDQSRNLEG